MEGIMSESEPGNGWSSVRLLIVGPVAVAAVLGLILGLVIVTGSVSDAAESEPVNVLANNDDECVICHRRTTAGIVE